MASYRDIERIGTGGNAHVSTCERDTDRKRFAKKRILPSADSDERDRFRREVRLLAKLDHPNIVTVVATHLDVEPLWFVMPLYKSSLDDQFPAIVGDMTRIVPVFGAILDAVEFAHAEGVIHRDLKPGNVLMNGDDDVVVSDFGLGRFVGSQSTRLTQSGEWMGTLLYIAPEQLRGTKAADERSDIFSLGRILYEIMTGRLTTAVQNTSSIDPAIGLIIDRCTMAKPADRFQSVTELKATWRAAVDVEDTGSDSQRLMQLTAKFGSGVIPHSAEVTEMFNMLSRHAEDNDLLHTTLMTLPVEVVGMFVKNDLNRARGLLRRFSDHISTTGWPFSYTDRIGGVLSRFYAGLADPVIRADLLHCAVELGTAHNRWYVMEIAKRLLNESRSPAENIALAQRIETASDRTKGWLRDNLSPARRDRMLARALEAPAN